MTFIGFMVYSGGLFAVYDAMAARGHSWTGAAARALTWPVVLGVEIARWTLRQPS